jgi:hypothetical protein
VGRTPNDRPGIDPTLRERVVDGMTVVSDALEAAVADPSDENLDELQESTDKLMRALGRILIEIAAQRGLPQR